MRSFGMSIVPQLDPIAPSSSTRKQVKTMKAHAPLILIILKATAAIMKAKVV